MFKISSRLLLSKIQYTGRFNSRALFCRYSLNAIFNLYKETSSIFDVGELLLFTNFFDFFTGVLSLLNLKRIALFLADSGISSICKLSGATYILEQFR